MGLAGVLLNLGTQLLQVDLSLGVYCANHCFCGFVPACFSCYEKFNLTIFEEEEFKSVVEL